MKKIRPHHVLHLPKRILRLYAGKAMCVEGRCMHPASQLVMKQLSRGKTDYTKITAQQLRAQLAQARKYAPPHRKLCITEDRSVDIGQVSIPIRVYRPRRKQQDRLARNQQPLSPVMLYFHGGGFVLFGIESHETFCQELAYYGGFTVISVAYRLAPEYPFPTAIEDGMAVYQAIHRQAAQWGLDGQKFSVGGDSAGGNIAAVLCQQLKGKSNAPVLQLLIYPPVGGDFERPARALFREGFFLSEEMIEWLAKQYLPDHPLHDITKLTDPRIAPMCHPDLSGLPACIMVIANFDPLRDDGFAYAKRLQQSGVAVETLFYEEQFHGFCAMGHFLPEASKATKQMAKRVALGLG